jgi:hypothetical protein
MLKPLENSIPAMVNAEAAPKFHPCCQVKDIDLAMDIILYKCLLKLLEIEHPPL